jgi:hypothetical protein
MHHYMWVDLAGSFAAICLYPLLAVAPGYAIAWLISLFDFRRRTAAFRIALSIPLSVATVPTLLYFADRFAPYPFALLIPAAAVVVCAWLAVRHGAPWPRLPRWAWGAALAWLAISLFLSIDLQIGARDYFPVTAADYSVRTAFIESIGAGVPPANPFFYPGHFAPLRYHYFWLLLPGLLFRATNGAISTRAAWIGGEFWCGLAFLCLIAIVLRVFWNHGNAPFRRRAMIAVLLTGVTGLDIIPTAGSWVLRAAGITAAVQPSLEWWNDQVDGFVFTAIWEAHYLAGLIGCVMALLLIFEGSRHMALSARVRYAAPAALILAGAAGTSIYIALVFAVFLLAWLTAAAIRRWWNLAAMLIASGAMAIPLALPHALSLRVASSGANAAPAPPLLQFTIRRFYPLDSLLHGQTAAAHFLGDLVALPLNYFLELGFFLVAGLAWRRMRRNSGKPLSPAELAVSLLIAVSLAICTFVRSSVIANNDLGWRGFLFAQLGLLLLATDVLSETPRPRRYLTLLVLGAAGSVYDLAILRTFPLLSDAGVVMSRDWLGGANAGAQIYSAREAYRWIAASTPRTAVIQFDPYTYSQNTAALLYSERQIAAADSQCLAAFGGDAAECRALVAAMAPVYARGVAPVSNLSESCRTLPVDYLVAEDRDAVWQIRNSWVWNERPAFANARFRIFPCRR